MAAGMLVDSSLDVDVLKNDDGRSLQKEERKLMMRVSGRAKAIFAAILVLAGLLTFGSTLRVGFLWDDHEMIENNPHISPLNLDNLRVAFTSDVFLGKGDAYYRPLQTVFNMIDYAIWKTNPFGFHLTNLTIHIVNAILLFGLLAALSIEIQVAFLASLCFVVHPIIVEQLLIIAGRAELMSLMFTLLALI